MEGLQKLRLGVQRLAARGVGIDPHRPKFMSAQQRLLFRANDISALPSSTTNKSAKLQVLTGEDAGTPYWMFGYDPLDSPLPRG